MKLIIAIVQDEDSSRLISKLMQTGLSATKLATTGGFLKAGHAFFIQFFLNMPVLLRFGKLPAILLLAPGDFNQKVPGEFRHFAPGEFRQS